MRSIEEANQRVRVAQAELDQANEELRMTKNALLGSIATDNCPECGSLIRLGNLPTKKGDVVNHIDCEGCNRRWEVHISYDGGDQYAPASYQADLVHRGFLTDTLAPDKLTGAQIELEKAYLASLGEGAIPSQRDRLKELLWEQVRRQDAGRIDTLIEQNASILEVLRAKLGV